MFRTNFTYARGEAGGGDGNAVQHSGRRQEKKSANHRDRRVPQRADSERLRRVSQQQKQKELTSLEDEGYRELHRRQRVPPGLAPGVYTVLTRLSHRSSDSLSMRSSPLGIADC